ncbi:MAG: PP2C family serine/threonine-protein phosphatase [Candidatus Cloacimonadales bacterium]|jgi:serine/threonine protein phosphatase PrpC|nr:PP2C family serine/threonine-protein phosphatase [Candidatus Cloacimonadales bacterium]
MKYKDFVVEAIRKEMQKSSKHPLTPEEALIKFACQQFSQLIDLDKDMLISDENIEIELFYEKLERSQGMQRKQLYLSFARFLDKMSEDYRFWYVIPYDKFYISADNKFVMNFYDYNEYCISDQKIISDSVRSEYSGFLPVHLGNKHISPEKVNKNLTKEAFWLFMQKTELPETPKRSRLIINLLLKVWYKFFKRKPEEKYLVRNIQANLNSYTTCEEIVNDFFRRQSQSICDEKPLNKLIWEYGFHTEQGRNKKSNQNEDSYHLIQLTNKQSMLFMLADGVSTANIGSGRLASVTILNYLEEKETEIKKFLISISQHDSKQWFAACKIKLIDIIRKINNKIIEEINDKIKDMSTEDLASKLDNPQSMCSTLILGFIDQNRALFAYMGDSQVYYVKGDNIMRINEDDSVLEERIIEHLETENKDVFVGKTDEDRKLTKVVPMTEYCEESNKFISVLKNEDINFFSFYPEADCYLLVCSDGLMDSLYGSGDEFNSERDLLRRFKALIVENEDKLRNVATAICREADDASGIDNITLLVLHAKEEIKGIELTIPKETNEVIKATEAKEVVKPTEQKTVFKPIKGGGNE